MRGPVPKIRGANVRGGFFAVLVLAVLLPQPGLTEEAPHSAARSETGSAATGTGAKGQTGGGTESGNKGSADRGANAGAKDAIDTRIAEPPRATTFNKPAGAATRWRRTGVTGPSNVFHNRAPNSLPAAPGTVRNATGVTIHNPAPPTATNSGRPGLLRGPSAFGPSGGAPNTGAGGSAVGNLPRTGATVGAPAFGHPNPGLGRAPLGPTANRTVINGTGMGRPGIGPATIGGPAKNASGINGTTVRPKR